MHELSCLLAELQSIYEDKKKTLAMNEGGKLGLPQVI